MVYLHINKLSKSLKYQVIETYYPESKKHLIRLYIPMNRKHKPKLASQSRLIVTAVPPKHFFIKLLLGWHNRCKPQVSFLHFSMAYQDT